MDESSLFDREKNMQAVDELALREKRTGRDTSAGLLRLLLHLQAAHYDILLNAYFSVQYLGKK
jgi:hypothetical protein